MMMRADERELVAQIHVFFLMFFWMEKDLAN